MKESNSQSDKPMTLQELKRFQRSGELPGRFSTNKNGEIEYDIKFIWRNKGEKYKSPQYRVYFGTYFRETKVESFSIGSGITYKTANIVILLDPPISVIDKYPVEAYYENPNKTGGRSNKGVGSVDGRQLLEKFFAAAQEVGINLMPPTKPDKGIVVECSLIPYSQNGVIDKNVLVVQIDQILNR